MTDADFWLIQQCRELNILEIFNQPITNDALNQLSFARLRELDIENCAIGTGKCSNASGSKLTRGNGDDFRFLGTLDRLQNLSFRGCSIGDDDLAEISKLRNIVILNLDQTCISDRALQYLKSLRLRSLSLSNTSITGQGFEGFSPDSIESLTLTGARVDEAGLAAISRLSGLKWLDLSKTQITDQSCAHLEGMNLTWLHLRDCRITDAALDKLCKIRSLFGLEFTGTQVTRAGIARLRSLPNLHCLIVDEQLLLDSDFLEELRAFPELDRVTYFDHSEWEVRPIVLQRPNGDQLHIQPRPK